MLSITDLRKIMVESLDLDLAHDDHEIGVSKYVLASTAQEEVTKDKAGREKNPWVAQLLTVFVEHNYVNLTCTIDLRVTWS